MNFGLKQEWVFSPNENCPKEIKDELRELWSICDLPNGGFIGWEKDDMEENYPALNKWLSEQGIAECLIVWGW